MDRVAVIEHRLRATFSPDFLEIIDDSDQHKGHPGAAAGGGHYTIIITSQHFHGKTRIEAHREIYAVLADLIPQEIHALKISCR